jgi:hypothetical protein
MLLTLSEPYHGNPEEDRFVLHMAWSQRPFFLKDPPSAASCATDTGSTTAASVREFKQQSLSARQATGCHWRGPRGQLRNAGELHLDIPFARSGTAVSGFIQVAVNYTGSDYQGTLGRVQPIIDTIRLP